MKKNNSRSVITALLVVLFLWTANARGQAGPPGGVGNGNDYIVLFRDGVAASERAATTARAGAGIRFNYSSVSAAAVNVPNANALAALSNNPAVLRVVPDRPVFAIQAKVSASAAKGKPGGGTTTGGQSTPLGVSRVGVPTSTSNGNGIGVAIIDTGIDFGHSDLAPSANFFSAFGSSCQDNNGHGTHVTGIVAALENSIDVIGVAPKATPYCVKVLDATGAGSDATVMAGLDWVAQNYNFVNPPIRVVNMSLGREGTLDDNPALRTSVQSLYKAGIVVVVAAGNDATQVVTQNVPATYPEVFAVASTTAADGINRCRLLSNPIFADTASFFTTDGKMSNVTGIGVTLSAPGEDQEDVNTACFISSVGILSTKLGGGTTRMSGSSMAAPHMSGIVARYIQGGMSDPESIRGYIVTQASRIGIAPLDSPTGSYSFDGEREGIAKAP